MGIEARECLIATDWMDEIVFRGSYDQCRTWLIVNDPYDELDYLICDVKTGRALSVVFTPPLVYAGFLEMRT